jgi:hypothetical protein
MNAESLAEILCGPPAGKTIWPQQRYESFRRSLSRERRAQDKRLLADVFRQAARVQLLKDALRWARAHEIRFLVDRNVNTHFMAYYGPGTGIVAVKKEVLEDRREAVNSVVHELRHALNDCQGLVPCNERDLTRHLQLQFLDEASAHGFGNAAGRQLWRAEHSFLSRFFSEKAMWNDFTAWYGSSDPVELGPAATMAYVMENCPELADAPDSEESGDAEDAGYEFDPGRAISSSYHKGLPLERHISALNRDFNGNAWFDEDKARDFFRAEMDPKRVLRFHAGLQAEPSPLVKKICDLRGLEI